MDGKPFERDRLRAVSLDFRLSRFRVFGRNNSRCLFVVNEKFCSKFFSGSCRLSLKGLIRWRPAANDEFLYGKKSANISKRITEAEFLIAYVLCRRGRESDVQ